MASHVLDITFESLNLTGKIISSWAITEEIHVHCTNTCSMQLNIVTEPAKKEIHSGCTIFILQSFATVAEILVRYTAGIHLFFACEFSLKLALDENPDKGKGKEIETDLESLD